MDIRIVQKSPLSPSFVLTTISFFPPRHKRPHQLMFASSRRSMILLLVLLCSTMVMPMPFNLPEVACRMNQGRNCSQDELATVHLSTNSGSSFGVNSTDLLLRNRFAFKAKYTNFYNPSMFVYNNTAWIVARLSMVNKFWESRNVQWVMCPGDSVYELQSCPTGVRALAFNFVVYFPVSKDGQLIGDVLALDYHSERHHVKEGVYIGAEDARYFEWNNGVYLIFSGAINTSSSLAMRRMFVRRLFPQITDPVQLSTPNALNAIEKNWSPIGPHVDHEGKETGDFLVSRYVNPHEVYRCRPDGHCITIASTNHSEFFHRFVKTHLIDNLHLATNAVRMSESHYGAIFHGQRKDISPILTRNNLDFPYLFSAYPPYAITHVAVKPLNLPFPEPSRQFKFSTGLTFIDGRLVVSYGINDSMNRFFVDTVENIFNPDKMVEIYD